MTEISRKHKFIFCFLFIFFLVVPLGSSFALKKKDTGKKSTIELQRKINKNVWFKDLVFYPSQKEEDKQFVKPIKEVKSKPWETQKAPPPASIEDKLISVWQKFKFWKFWFAGKTEVVEVEFSPESYAILSFNFLVYNSKAELKKIQYRVLSDPLRKAQEISETYFELELILELTTGNETHTVRLPSQEHMIAENFNTDGSISSVKYEQIDNNLPFFKVPLEKPIPAGTKGSFSLRKVSPDEVKNLISDETFFVPNDVSSQNTSFNKKGTIKALVKSILSLTSAHAGLADDCSLIKEVILGHNGPGGDNRINVLFECVGYDSEESCLEDVKKIVDYDGVGIANPPPTANPLNKGFFGAEPFKSNKDAFALWYYYDPTTPIIIPPNYCSTHPDGWYVWADYCVNACPGILGYNGISASNEILEKLNACGINPYNTKGISLCSVGCTATAKYFHAALSTGLMVCENGQPKPESIDFFNGNLNVFLHEFGHSFGKLRDEYVEPAYVYTWIPGYPNCAATKEEALQWWPEWNEEELYPGCVNFTRFRLSETSIMRTVNTEDFKLINSLHLCDKILESTGSRSEYCDQIWNTYYNKPMTIPDVTIYGFYSALNFNGKYLLFSTDQFEKNSQEPVIVSDYMNAFVYNAKDNKFELISTNNDNTILNAYARGVSISNNGRYVMFVSAANNVFPSLPPGNKNIYLRDRAEQQTFFINISNPFDFPANSSGDRHPDMSGDARYFVYAGKTPEGLATITLYDRITSSANIISVDQNNQPQYNVDGVPDISENGDYVLYTRSQAGVVCQVVLYDRKSGSREVIECETISQDYNIDYANVNAKISNSGDLIFVTFYESDYKGHGLLYNRKTGTAQKLYSDQSAWSVLPFAEFSSDDLYLIFATNSNEYGPEELNGKTKAYTYKISTGETALASRDSAGNPKETKYYPISISEDGRYIAFTSPGPKTYIIPNPFLE